MRWPKKMKNKANPARTLSQEHPDRSGSSIPDSLESKHSAKQELSLHRLVYKRQQTQPRNGMSSPTAHEEGSFSETNAAMISSGIFSCSLQAGIGPIPGVSVGVIRTEVVAKSPARCRLSHWTVDSPGGTERAASPPAAASALTAGPLLEEHAATPGTYFPPLLILYVIV